MWVYERDMDWGQKCSKRTCVKVFLKKERGNHHCSQTDCQVPDAVYVKLSVCEIQCVCAMQCMQDTVRDAVCMRRGVCETQCMSDALCVRLSACETVWETQCMRHAACVKLSVCEVQCLQDAVCEMQCVWDTVYMRRSVCEMQCVRVRQCMWGSAAAVRLCTCKCAIESSSEWWHFNAVIDLVKNLLGCHMPCRGGSDLWRVCVSTTHWTHMYHGCQFAW